MIHERHRHRYEFNNKYRPLFEKKGLTLSGICEDRDLVEIIENHRTSLVRGCAVPPGISIQTLGASPLFKNFVAAGLEYRRKHLEKVHGPSRFGDGKQVPPCPTSNEPGQSSSVV